MKHLYIITLIILFGSCQSEHDTIYTICQQRIKDDVKVPSSTKFSSVGETTLTKYAPNRALLKGDFESENTFGALIKEPFRCSVQNIDGRWKIVRVLYEDSNDYAYAPADDETNKPTVSYEVENVTVEKKYPNAWGVKGKIRNNSTRDISGAVTIKFVNAQGDIIHTDRAFVNDGDPFSSGRAAPFEYYTEPTDFDGVTDFDIIFYER